MEILVSGATGAIGQVLVKELAKNNHNITAISRNCKKVIDLYGSKIQSLNWSELNKIKNEPEIIIHLAGHNIGNCIWSQKNKAMAIASRIETAQMLSTWCKKQQINPRIFAASGVSYYGLFKDCQLICNETTPAIINHKKFMQELAFACENTFMDFNVIKLRLAPVLQLKYGMLPKLISSTKLGFASVIGNGKQPVSWIAIEDVVKIILFLLSKPEIMGPINLVSPEIIDQTTFCNQLAYKLKRPVLFKTPAKLLELLAGDFAEQLLTHGQAVTPQRLTQLNYEFKFNSFNSWLEANL